MTAPAIRQQLNQMNINYLSLLSRRSQERRCYIFSADLDDTITLQRNKIIQLQQQLRKAVKHNR